MSSLSLEFSSASTSRTMEVDIDDDQQREPQQKVPSASQTAYDTISTPVYHDQEYKPQGLIASCSVSIDDKPFNTNLEANYNGNSSEDYKDFFASLPPGYRFRPTKEELIKFYLFPKIKGDKLPPSHIRDANLYEHSPDIITERYPSDENEWYFFTPRDRKYPNGDRPNRAAGTGYWKATGADVKIKDYDNETIIGYKKSLVYHEGKAPNGGKTNWIMHEYRVSGKPKEEKKMAKMRLDNYVLCRIYKKNGKSLTGREEKVEDGGSSATATPTCVKHYNNTTGVDSSRLMTSHQDRLPRVPVNYSSHQDGLLMDAPRVPVNCSSHLPAAPLGFGQFSSNQSMSLSMQPQQDTAYQPSEWGFCYPEYAHEFEVTCPNMDSIFDPIDDYNLSPPSPPPPPPS